MEIAAFWRDYKIKCSTLIKQKSIQHTGLTLDLGMTIATTILRKILIAYRKFIETLWNRGKYVNNNYS
jgi:hypothetical protein